MPDVREFRTVCHAVARQTAGSLVDFRVAKHVTPNFHQGVIAYWGWTVALVCNRDTPLVAIAEPRLTEDINALESGPLTFIEAPELRDALATFPGYRVLGTAELNANFRQTDWPHVATSDIEYWRPATVGEALFNYWD